MENKIKGYPVLLSTDKGKIILISNMVYIMKIQDLPNSIVVTIPVKGEYSSSKYGGNNQRCYLEEALDKAKFQRVKVGALGITTVSGAEYRPAEDFDNEIVQQAFKDQKDIEVILLKL